MINYFKAAERVLYTRKDLDRALDNLERRKLRIIKSMAPKGYPSVDTTQPYTSSSKCNDALAECLELSEISREIANTKQIVEEIDEILRQMDQTEAELLREWYILGNTKEEIMAKVNYSSTSTIYELRNKAVSRFAVLYFGAGAISSI